MKEKKKVSLLKWDKVVYARIGVITSLTILLTISMVKSNRYKKDITLLNSRILDLKYTIEEVKNSNKALEDTSKEKSDIIEALKKENNTLIKEKEELQKEKLNLQKKHLNEKPTRGGLRTTQVQGGSFKSYMDYRAITNKSSLQWKLQQQAHTFQGYRRIGESFMVAVGSGVGSVGQYGELIMTSGKIYSIIVGDQKDDRHTDSSNIYHLTDGSAVEFIVDKNTLSKKAKQMGNISYCTNIDFSGNIAKVIIFNN